MQIGIFSIGDRIPDVVTGDTLSDFDRLDQMVTQAVDAEAAGFDVYAIGEHHNPPLDRAGIAAAEHEIRSTSS